MPLDLRLLEKEKESLNATEIDKLHLYINEAQFFFQVIREDVEGPPLDIFEIGSGIGLLSRLLGENGHSVVGTDPISSGFNVVTKLQRVIEKSFITPQKGPEFHALSAQQINVKMKREQKFDYIFCANVVEHVSELKFFFDAVLPRLKDGGTFRFICPNYLFPYEPHFGFISTPSKRLTRLMQGNKIRHSHIENPEDFYNDLSFPNIFKLNKILGQYEIYAKYRNTATLEYLDRAVKDEYFILRKKKIASVVRIIIKPIKKIIRILPKSSLPIIDCKIVKKNSFSKNINLS